MIFVELENTNTVHSFKLASFIISDALFRSLVDDHECVYIAVGCHPKSAQDFSEKQEDAMKEMLKEKCVKAVGEIGLDYSGKSVNIMFEYYAVKLVRNLTFLYKYSNVFFFPVIPFN